MFKIWLGTGILLGVASIRTYDAYSNAGNVPFTTATYLLMIWIVVGLAVMAWKLLLAMLGQASAAVRQKEVVIVPVEVAPTQPAVMQFVERVEPHF